MRVPSLRTIAISAGITMLLLAPQARSLTETDLSSLLQEARAEMRAPGLRAAIVTQEGRLVQSAVGVSDTRTETPLDDEIGMPGGSTGKMFAATLAMLLIEEGALGADDKAAAWVGDAPWYSKLPNADDIRVRHLLSHSTGMADYPPTMCFQMRMTGRVLRRGSAYFEPEELIRCAAGKRARFAPGAGYRYTDAGYLVLGRIIEAAGNDDYYELLHARILDPLELDGIRPQLESALPGIATGYSGGGSVIRKDGRMKFDPRSEWTGGGLVMTPTMLARFVAALAAGEVVTPQTLADMKDGGWHDPDEPDWHYGFGMFVYADGSFGHAGRWPGYRTRVRHDATSGATVAVQANRDGRLDLAGLIQRILALHALSED